MNVLQNSLLSVAVCVALITTSCSSSNDNTVGTAGSAHLTNDLSDPVSGGVVTSEPGADNSGTTPTGRGVLKMSSAYPDLLRAMAGSQLESLAEEVVLIGDVMSVERDKHMILCGHAPRRSTRRPCQGKSRHEKKGSRCGTSR